MSYLTSTILEISTMTSTALVVGFVSLLVLWLLRRSSVRLPPGPRPLPFFGNTLLLRKYPSLPDLVVELKRQYGPIVTFWMFQTPMVIISSPDIIQEAMITQGSVFAGRNQHKSTAILNNGHRTVTSAKGERHRFLRKLLVSEVLSNKRVAELRPIRDREVDILIETLTKQVKQGDADNSNRGRAVVTNFRPLIRLTICNLIMGALIGRRLTLEEYEKVDEVMVKRLFMFLGKASDYHPLLALLPDKKGIKLQQQMLEIMAKTFEPLIKERRQELKKGNQANQNGFVDTLLQLQSGDTQQNPNTDIFDLDIVVLCMDILSAGTDTTALTLEYCIGNLMNQPDVQEKLVHEISNVVGRERVVDQDDIPRLPYLQAVVTEVLRRHSPGRLSPSRRSLSAAKVAGYDIPANTIVYQNLEAVALSSQIWENPLEFRPERHLNKTMDWTGSSTDVKMIPFGMGRRICPAANMALLHIELILARLIQAFEWKLATPGQSVDLTAAFGITAPMKYPLVTCLSERLIVS